MRWLLFSRRRGLRFVLPDLTAMTVLPTLSAARLSRRCGRFSLGVRFFLLVGVVAVCGSHLVKEVVELGPGGGKLLKGDERVRPILLILVFFLVLNLLQGDKGGEDVAHLIRVGLHHPFLHLGDEVGFGLL